MANWVLRCKRCHELFTYAAISESLADYFVPAKPELPDEGKQCACLHCGVKSTYLRGDLTYQSTRKSAGESRP